MSPCYALPHLFVRLDHDLKEFVRAEAKRHRRSINSQVIEILIEHRERRQGATRAPSAA
ncbi:MAG: Arc family DNA-binding protein [Methylobacterium sp.]|uniref:TA system antitoxin ParD family protein n=1 Tax=Methylobacterium sp. TaxID=409 RepID=UPI00258A38DF|nr:Arc family DNA-binding protein [Methylobacterium sp.]MBY0299836.1 Arc family DNA-binding protein [Methylobacterium sp.]